MTSTVPFQVIDDNDDEFDWEAAVREIDFACERANKPSFTTINQASSSNFTPPANILNNSTSYSSTKTGTCKQSTLDKFIGKARPPVNPTVEVRHHQGNGIINSDERPCCVEIDAEAAKTWIYPVNVPLREYQLAITKTALFTNTLVALPTGLGKTLIAAVVMYNYFRWFPDGKIVFAAPSRPLVMQQIEACHNIVGIPQEWTIDMTGQVCPTKRACFWKSKRVFFVTPQVLERDIQSGTCLAKHLVCLVIDEAHRASGNYSYCVAIRELLAIPVQPRILALTATPGSKQPAVQQIIDNLQISALEYRNESDPDVIPYVHDRKIELIEVALGKEAVDINKQLVEVIRPYVARLSTLGLLQNRDYQTLSPPDLLNSRDKFRRAPPLDLPQNRYGEIEACFGGLITLSHIRKLLSSHGIRPAYEMLEEKLKQGPFARLMSKNEDVWKVKLLMQQSLSHGAPSPKLSKMVEVLVDHFKTKDPQNSRVIIFSNFRGSVRDIMNTLATIGDLVKATEFIGQSSGLKTLKGQSQKVQQAVLQKFRTGGYNVIVATSIGEEGLDIMEVDLVVCFDANVSPLRMIQRMGRTGRKHDGRLPTFLDKVSLVLACEGSELKGYMRKQANSRSIKKHMHNGGINSFSFHSSSRMIPHIFKPEVQFVEISIEQYVPRGKKVKDDNTIETPVFKENLTVAETALLAKYFHPGNTWTPSLIAFPRFQSFPSRVHKVMHSYRTEMLINSMQHLQDLTFTREMDSGATIKFHVFRLKDVAGPMTWDNPPSTKSQEKVVDSEESPIQTLRPDNEHSMLNLNKPSHPAHSYLFGSDYVSVDSLGKVQIMSVPLFPTEEATHSKGQSSQKDKELTTPHKSSMDLTTLRHKKTLDLMETIPEASVLKRNLPNEEDCASKSLDVLGIKASSLQADEFNKKFKDSELSPRLTNMIQSGIVPESPINDHGLLNDEGKNEFIVQDLISPTKLCTELPSKLQSPQKNETVMDSRGCQKEFSVSPSINEFETPPLKNVARKGRFTSISPVVEETDSPLANLTKGSNSKDWLLSSGNKLEDVERVCKFKRLRKVGDIEERKNSKGTKENSTIPIKNLNRSFSGKKKRVGNVRAFIEEEAEVSSEAEISDDEADDPGNSSYDDSFIDDRINPTVASADSEASRADMMAVYRRSLLSQSPMARESSSSATFTPDHGASTSRINGSGSSSVKTPQTDSANQSAGRDIGPFQINQERISAARPCTTTDFQRENTTRSETRKGRFSFCQPSIPALNLEQKLSSQSEVPQKASFQQGPADKTDANEDMFYDDHFFATLDLDAVEAQATLLLKQRSDLSVQKQDLILNSDLQNLDLQSSPSFDLGIL
ncbi:DEAD-box ATP-dependent RNA helicase FANCM [Salix suchowensis]|nr:DEAD-box ATP-dependent RNA helicase FANCM [Salix suchowensis]